jgi:hypothetical protein
MAKDPAVLLYTQDFIAGTILMTDEQRGKYILLLCFQHQKEYLTEQDMLKICGTYDSVIWEKFNKEGDKYFNIRMREESEKRRTWCDSRRKNRRNKIDKSDYKGKSSEHHMSQHMANENENKNGSKINKPTIDEIKKYCVERNNSVSSEKFFDFYESKGWLVGKNPMKDWKAAIRNWENNTIKPAIVEKGSHPGQILLTGQIKPY